MVEATVKLPYCSFYDGDEYSLNYYLFNNDTVSLDTELKMNFYNLVFEDMTEESRLGNNPLIHTKLMERESKNTLSYNPTEEGMEMIYRFIDFYTDKIRANLLKANFTNNESAYYFEFPERSNIRYFSHDCCLPVRISIVYNSSAGMTSFMLFPKSSSKRFTIVPINGEYCTKPPSVMSPGRFATIFLSVDCIFKTAMYIVNKIYGLNVSQSNFKVKYSVISKEQVPNFNNIVKTYNSPALSEYENLVNTLGDIITERKIIFRSQVLYNIEFDLEDEIFQVNTTFR